jgi:hypothetical protein
MTAPMILLNSILFFALVFPVVNYNALTSSSTLPFHLVGDCPTLLVPSGFVNVISEQYQSDSLRHNQTRKAINALNSIWWHKDITKKWYIYQTIIQSILMYGAEV